MDQPQSVQVYNAVCIDYLVNFAKQFWCRMWCVCICCIRPQGVIRHGDICEINFPLKAPKFVFILPPSASKQRKINMKTHKNGYARKYKK